MLIPPELQRYLPDNLDDLTKLTHDPLILSFIQRFVYPALESVARSIESGAKSLFSKTGKMVKDIPPAPPESINHKLVLDIIIEGSSTTNDSLQDMWASLLANATTSNVPKVRPIFVSILKQLNPDDAQLFTSIASVYFELRKLYTKPNWTAQQQKTIADRPYREFSALPGENESERMQRSAVGIQTLFAL